MKAWLAARGGELAAGAGLLTRLPVGRLVPPEVDFARAAWSYPVVGAGIGLLGGLAQAGLLWAGLPPALAACWTLAALVLLTGGLHEDGLADTADGLGGGRTRARKLEIMRDSRVGSFGALALLLSTAIRITGLGAITAPSQALAALVVSACLSRAALLGVLVAVPPARRDGMAAGLAAVPRASAAAGILAGVLAALALLPLREAILALGLAALAAALLARLARRQLGGYTGDILGATAVLTDAMVLSGLTVFLHHL